MKFTHIVIRRMEYISSNEDKVLSYHDEAVRQEKIARAAPELLEALEVLIEGSRHCGEVSWCGESDLSPWEKARAAIAKAKE